MSLTHLKSGEVLNLRTLKADMPTNSTFALVKTTDVEVIRMVLPKGKKIPEHSVPGKITVQCLSGSMQFTVGAESLNLEADSWFYLDGNEPHSLEALSDTTLLVTILLQ